MAFNPNKKQTLDEADYRVALQSILSWYVDLLTPHVESSALLVFHVLKRMLEYTLWERKDDTSPMNEWCAIYLTDPSFCIGGLRCLLQEFFK